MIALKLAYRNLVGAGLRTLLIVVVLSLAYVLIIFMNGLYQGWDRQARFETIEWEVAQGQYWHDMYDPYDAMTLTDAHAPVPPALKESVETGNAAPILVTQATIYPEGRMMGALLKGIDTRQNILSLPTHLLEPESNEITAVIGTRLAKSANLETGDYILARWRDVHGTFDATEIRIAAVFHSSVPAIDNGQLWVPLSKLQEITGMPGETTLIVVGKNAISQESISGWEFKDHDFLFKELEQMIKTKSVGGSIFYLIILALALLAIFDTQVLSIFRRQREIGTYIAMGMTRREVVGIFTVEGAMHALLALFAGAIYGIPLLLWIKSTGISMPEGTDDFGMAASEHMIPYYSATLVFGTIILVMIATTIVSYLPSRRITKMNPNDAIRGKIQ
ncbi:MAG: FtsX-like permease family protein [Bacteroidales bacterium]|nr:FtsX-like permease family protein [Bacteroidales bacterium]